jgi:hypothetical protein
VQVEARLRQLEGRSLGADSAVKGKGKGEPAKYDSSKPARAYNADADAAPVEAAKKEKKEKTEKVGYSLFCFLCLVLVKEIKAWPLTMLRVQARMLSVQLLCVEALCILG